MTSTIARTAPIVSRSRSRRLVAWRCVLGSGDGSAVVSKKALVLLLPAVLAFKNTVGNNAANAGASDAADATPAVGDDGGAEEAMQ